MIIGYLTSRYPAVSHSFVQREVKALRAQGVDVRTMALHRAADSEVLSRADREERETTFAVRPLGVTALLRAHARALAAHPARYVRTLVRAMELAPPGLRGLLYQLFYFAEAVVVWGNCRATGVRHIHAQFADAGTDVALLAACLGGRGWSWSLAVHGPVEFYNVRLYRLEQKLRDARLAIAISDFGRSQLMTLLGADEWGKLHVVHCGVEPAVYEAVVRDDAPGREIDVLCVGRLVGLKGQLLLVEAIASLRERGTRVRATVVGDGPQRAELERRARSLGVAGAIRFTGSVGQDEIRSLYADADVFCLPSFAEGVPVVLMEAMATGLPVVSTKVMGIPELVEDGVAGILVAPGRLDQLVAALERLANDPGLRERFGRSGRQKVLAEYNVAESGALLRRIFADALGES